MRVAYLLVLSGLIALTVAGRSPRYPSGLDHPSYLDAPARPAPKESDDPCHEVEDRYLAYIERLEDSLLATSPQAGKSPARAVNEDRGAMVRAVATTLQTVSSSAEVTEDCERMLKERTLSRHFEYAAIGSQEGERDEAPIRGDAKRSCETMLQRHQLRNRRLATAHAERTLELLEADRAVVVLSTRGTSAESFVYRFDSDGSVALIQELTAFASKSSGK